MKHFFVALFGLLAMGVFATPALAGYHPGDPGNGYIEVCKAPSPDLNGSFKFAITDGRTQYVVVPIGLCSAPIEVEAGPVTIEELGSLLGMADDGSSTLSSSFLGHPSVTAVGWDGPITPTAVGGGGFTYRVDVPSSWADTTKVVTVTYSNTLVTGVIEVCKEIVPDTGLTGSYEFTITGSNGTAPIQVTVPIGACSPAITVPAGNFKVVETGDLDQNVVEIDAVMPASGHDMIVGPKYGHADLASATVIAEVTAGDATMQTLVTYVNDPVRLKVCKVWSAMSPDPKPAGGYPFSFTASSSPITGSVSPLAIPAGTRDHPNCVVVGSFRPGTVVGIAEGVVPGTKVKSIEVNASDRIQAPGPSLTSRTVSVVLGPGETVVTYTDTSALPGVLKICKAAGSGVATGTVFSFTIGVSTFNVPAGSCVVAGSYPFNSTQTIVESANAGTAVSSIGVNPSSREVSQSIAARMVSTLIGENDVTEVTFTNAVAVVPSAGGTSGGGSSGGGSAATASSSEETTAGLSSANTGIVPGSIVSPAGVSIAAGAEVTKAAVVSQAALKAQVAARAKAVTKAKAIASVKSKLLAVQKQHHMLVEKRAATQTIAARRSLTKQINVLKLQERRMIENVQLLSLQQRQYTLVAQRAVTSATAARLSLAERITTLKLQQSKVMEAIKALR